VVSVLGVMTGIDLYKVWLSNNETGIERLRKHFLDLLKIALLPVAD